MTKLPVLFVSLCECYITTLQHNSSPVTDKVYFFRVFPIFNPLPDDKILDGS